MIRKVKIALGILMGTGLVFLTLWWLKQQDMFVLNRVRIGGNKILTSEEILELAYLDFSQELFDFDSEIVEERILQNELINDVHIRRIFPSGIIIDVKEKDIIGCCVGSRLHLIDSQGQVTLSDNFNAIYDMPVVTGTEMEIDTLGRMVVSNNMGLAAGVLKGIRNVNYKLYHDISEVNYNPNTGIVLFLRKEATTIVLGKDNLAQKILDFSIYYNQMKNQKDLTTYKLIDVRFDGQIVVKK